MKILFMFFLLIYSTAFPISLVYVHLGSKIPDYCFDSINQTNLFNKIPIFLLANKEAINNTKFPKIENLKIVEIETLERSAEHIKFINETKLLGSFWIYAIERFFYLHEFIKKNQLEDVFHIENDVMLYEDLNLLLPTFKQNYNGIAAVFDNDERCIASFMYIPNKNAINHMITFFSDNSFLNLFDMHLIAKYKNSYSENIINNLPIIMNEYIEKYGLISTNNHKTKNPMQYCKNIEYFNSIFDAAAIGQYLGGIDPIHKNNSPGFINETCLFNSSLLKYEWQLDIQNRKIPYAIFENKKYKINNLHIHSKNLKNFLSK